MAEQLDCARETPWLKRSRLEQERSLREVGENVTNYANNFRRRGLADPVPVAGARGA
jgi:hypothetical protein